MNKLVSKLRDTKLPKKTPQGGHIDLEKRVQYAINCLEADMPHKAEKARAVLMDAKSRLDNPELISKIDRILNDGT